MSQFTTSQHLLSIVLGIDLQVWRGSPGAAQLDVDYDKMTVVLPECTVMAYAAFTLNVTFNAEVAVRIIAPVAFSGNFLFRQIAVLRRDGHTEHGFRRMSEADSDGQYPDDSPFVQMYPAALVTGEDRLAITVYNSSSEPQRFQLALVGRYLFSAYERLVSREKHAATLRAEYEEKYGRAVAGVTGICAPFGPIGPTGSLSGPTGPTGPSANPHVPATKKPTISPTKRRQIALLKKKLAKK